MCTLFGKPRKLGRDITAYKVVNKQYGQFVSQFACHSRRTLADYPDQGHVLKYEIGRTRRSPSGPGIMAYLRKKDARPADFREKVIAVRIPPTAKVIRGEHNGKRIIAASRVRVVREVA